MANFSPKSVQRIRRVVRAVESTFPDHAAGQRRAPFKHNGWWGKIITNHTAGRYTVRKVVPQNNGTFSDLSPVFDVADVYHATRDAGLPPDYIVWVTQSGYTAGGNPLLHFAGPSSPLLGKLTASAGSAGDEDNDCAFTYTLADLAGNQLATGLTPKRPRFPKTTYTAAPADSYATYVHDGTNFILLDAIEEWPQSDNCDEGA